jgi:hypothetical protein
MRHRTSPAERAGRQPQRIAPCPPPAGVRARQGPADRLPPTPPEEAAIDLDATVSANLVPIVIVLAVTAVVLLVLVAWLARRVGRLEARIRGLTRGEDGDFGDVLGAHLDRVYQLGREVERLGARTERLEAGAPRAFQRVGLVRFNPFEDTGGNQSFALALLDADGNGWVLSSLHARTGTRMYAKAIRAGRADGALSEEEASAIKQASA